MSQLKDRRWGDLVLWGPFTAITDADLDRVEHVIGAALPDDYRSYCDRIQQPLWPAFSRAPVPTSATGAAGGLSA